MKLLKADKRYNRPEDGFSLYQDGYRTFIGMSYIDKLIMVNATHQTMLAILNMKKEKEMATSGYINGRPTLKRNNYIVGSQNKGNGLISITNDNPAQHESEGVALAEAGRLAKQYPDRKFVVFKIVGTASVNDVIWE